MDEEHPGNQVWPPPPTAPSPEEIQSPAKPSGRAWPYLGGLILSIGGELYTRAALEAADGWCGQVLQSPGVLLIVLGALLWSVADITRGALTKKPFSIVLGSIGVCISLYALAGIFENLSCRN